MCVSMCVFVVYVHVYIPIVWQEVMRCLICLSNLLKHTILHLKFNLSLYGSCITGTSMRISEMYKAINIYEKRITHLN